MWKAISRVIRSCLVEPRLITVIVEVDRIGIDQANLGIIEVSKSMIEQTIQILRG